MTDRARYTFTVKDHEAGVFWIAAEPLNAPIAALNGKMIGFDLPDGTSQTQAEEIARFMSYNLKAIQLF